MRRIILAAVAAAMAYAPAASAMSDAGPSYDSRSYHIPMVGFDRAWSLTEGSPEVKVAVVDTGIDLRHPEFLSANLDPLSFNANDDMVGLEYVMDDGGHGTMVAGVIVSSSRDSVGSSGVAPNLTLMVVKANKVPANIYSPLRVAKGIRYAADNGAHVINVSLGSETLDQTVADAVAYAQGAGSVVVAAAGNTKRDVPNYPAALDGVVAVSSVDRDGMLSSFSSYGSHIGVAAPGREIYMPRMLRDDPTLPIYSTLNGTSFAAPQVSAALAMIKSQNPEMTGQEMVDRLISTATDAGEPGHDSRYGHGIINVADALGVTEEEVASSEANSSSETHATSEPSTNEASSSEEAPSSPESSEEAPSSPESSEEQPSSDLSSWTPPTTTEETTSSEPEVESPEEETMPEETTSSEPEVESPEEETMPEETTEPEGESPEGTPTTEPARIWTVTFRVAGRIYAEVLVEDGGTVDRPSDPSMTNRFRFRATFRGWIESETGEQFDFSSPVNGDIELSARFAVRVVIRPPFCMTLRCVARSE
jgi:subtilisin family serine protease